MAEREEKIVGSGFQIFKILGIPIRINYSWFAVFFLVSWTLAVGYFPSQIPHLSRVQTWTLSLFAAALFFASILFHELAHSYVAQRSGISILQITLFIFGGVAQMAGESRTPRTEMAIAAAGPLASIFLAGMFWGIGTLPELSGENKVLVAVCGFLAMSNGMLAVFNMIPGFPLDGGRILCAILWKLTDNIQKATRITSWIGKGVAVVLMIYGFLEVLQGYLLNGLWMVFIGVFLQQAAEAGYQNVLMRHSLSALRVVDLMKSPAVSVQSAMSLDTLVNDYFFRYRYNSFPVLDGERLEGMVSLNHVKTIDRQQWPVYPVAQIMDKDLSSLTVSRESAVVDALETMVRTHQGRLAVTAEGRLVGIISQRDILQAMKVKVDLGG